MMLPEFAIVVFITLLNPMTGLGKLLESGVEKSLLQENKMKCFAGFVLLVVPQRDLLFLFFFLFFSFFFFSSFPGVIR